MQCRAHDHVPRPQELIVLLPAIRIPKVMNPIFQPQSCLLKHDRDICIVFAEDRDAEIYSLVLQRVERREEGYRVLVVLPPVRPHDVQGVQPRPTLPRKQLEPFIDRKVAHACFTTDLGCYPLPVRFEVRLKVQVLRYVLKEGFQVI